jgi:hypothetical protein
MNRLVLSTTFLAVGAALAACSWGIKLDSGGENVRVAWDGNTNRCRDSGKVTVSVLDRVGPVDRSSTKVSDELEVMARNEAAGMGADTIKPLGPPENGQQSWGAYACGSIVRVPVRRAGDASPAPQHEGEVETYPVKDH